MAVMAASAVANMFVVRHVLAVGRRTRSQALLAVAEDHRTDILSALGVLLGLVLVRMTGKGLFDPAMALVISCFILRTAWRLGSGALTPLMDGQLPREELGVVRSVLDAEAGVMGYHKLRTRLSGAARFVDAHVLVDDDLTLGDAHELTEQVEEKIRKVLPNTEMTLYGAIPRRATPPG